MGNFCYICSMKTNLNSIGKLLARQRKSKGLTQAEAGALIGVRKAMVSKIENGKIVNVNSIGRLADALGVEPVVELEAARRPDKNVIEYVMTAIIEFARHHAFSVREASNYLNRFKGIDFLMDFYDVEHLLSFDDCVADLTAVCRNNGGASQECSNSVAEKDMNERNAQFLFEGISSDVVRFLVERNKMSLPEAISTFHNSETFAKLEDFDTELYVESPAYIYELLLTELRYGRLRQEP